jgi:hypothetical protein
LRQDFFVGKKVRFHIKVKNVNAVSGRKEAAAAEKK